MKITRHGAPASPGPPEWFTGEVLMEPLAQPVHVTMQQADAEGRIAMWGDHVSDEEHDPA